MNSTTMSQHQFSQIPSVEIQRSVFDRSHGHKTTFNAGDLIPFLVDEVLPGDTFTVRSSIFARLATPMVPIMDNLWLDTFYFAVPCRLLWDHWKQMMGEQKNPGDSIDYTVPYVQAPNTTGFVANTIYDYMGLPVGKPKIRVNALPLRAYNMIVNEWFRDENLMSAVDTNDDDGPDPVESYNIVKRGKRHDYFTSCLPWAQKGDPILLGIGDEAPVYGTGKSLGLTNSIHNFSPYLDTDSYSSLINDRGLYNSNVGTGRPTTPTPPTNQNISVGVVTSGASGLYADLSEATSVTVNALRQAFQLQKMLERDARGGTRYTELIRSHFGIISPDARQQRPEYLGGSSNRINIHPVQQTSQTGTTPQGHLAAFGLCATQDGGFSKSFTEHCYIIGIANVRADLNYQQGLNRMWSRQTKYDFYWPSLAHLGEQAVLNKEIYCQGNESAVDEQVFGYNERYAEYRYFPSMITGQFRSSYSTPLHMWHLAENFTTLPVLADTFIQDNTASILNRCIAVSENTGPQFLFDSFIQMRCARPMPVYSVPGMIDHF